MTANKVQQTETPLRDELDKRWQAKLAEIPDDLPRLVICALSALSDFDKLASHLERDLAGLREKVEWIVAAAVKTDNGAIHFMPKPCRHHHTIHALSKMLGPSNQRGVEGFITSNGVFVNRIEAMLIATANGQLLKPSSKRELYSEDLW